MTGLARVVRHVAELATPRVFACFVEILEAAEEHRVRKAVEQDQRHARLDGRANQQQIADYLKLLEAEEEIPNRSVRHANRVERSPPA